MRERQHRACFSCAETWAVPAFFNFQCIRRRHVQPDPAALQPGLVALDAHLDLRVQRQARHHTVFACPLDVVFDPQRTRVGVQRKRSPVRQIVADLVGIEHTALGIDYYRFQEGVAELPVAEAAYRHAVDTGEEALRIDLSRLQVVEHNGLGGHVLAI